MLNTVGVLRQAGAAGGTSSNFTDPFPLVGTAAGANKTSDGTMQALQVDDSGNLKVAGSLSVTPTAAATSALTNVNDGATSTTLLAANAGRYAFTIYNDSTELLYVKCGATASVTSFTAVLLPQMTWGTRDLGVNYTGKIDGIWANDASGAARVTEFSV